MIERRECLPRASNNYHGVIQVKEELPVEMKVDSMCESPNGRSSEPHTNQAKENAYKNAVSTDLLIKLIMS